MPGYNTGYPTGDLNQAVGPKLVSYYSSAYFKPGTKVRWEPSVSFNTGGRIAVGFTDNPEVAVVIQALLDAYVASPTGSNYVAYANQVRALGSTLSFPVWQETEIPFPTRLRRKRFDVEATPATGDTDNFDRSMQVMMFACCETSQTEGAVGSFWFHDVVDVEGLHGVLT
jgi:hypothetical protein